MDRPRKKPQKWKATPRRAVYINGDVVFVSRRVTLTIETDRKVSREDGIDEPPETTVK